MLNSNLPPGSIALNETGEIKFIFCSNNGANDRPGIGESDTSAA